MLQMAICQKLTVTSGRLYLVAQHNVSCWNQQQQWLLNLPPMQERHLKMRCKIPSCA